MGLWVSRTLARPIPDEHCPSPSTPRWVTFFNFTPGCRIVSELEPFCSLFAPTPPDLHAPDLDARTFGTPTSPHDSNLWGTSIVYSVPNGHPPEKHAAYMRTHWQRPKATVLVIIQRPWCDHQQLWSSELERRPFISDIFPPSYFVVTCSSGKANFPLIKQWTLDPFVQARVLAGVSRACRMVRQLVRQRMGGVFDFGLLILGQIVAEHMRLPTDHPAVWKLTMVILERTAGLPARWPISLDDMLVAFDV